jgi:hypothetical protein
MGSVSLQPATLPGVGNDLISIDVQGCSDSPCYYGNNQPMMVGSGGTVAASATVGNLTLTTALDAIYGPTNNNVPGIWLYLPSTALAAPLNVAGWYWAVMTSTTVGTVYTAQPLNGGVASPNYLPAPVIANVSGQVLTNPWATPSGALAIATGSGAGYTGVTSAVPASVYQVLGGFLSSTGSVSFAGSITGNNSAGAKTLRGVLSTAATLASPTIVATTAITTGLSALLTVGTLLMAGANNAWRYITVGSTPTFGSTDLSVTEYVGTTLQVAVATDWAIQQSSYITCNQG